MGSPRADMGVMRAATARIGPDRVGERRSAVGEGEGGVGGAEVVMGGIDRRSLQRCVLPPESLADDLSRGVDEEREGKENKTAEEEDAIVRAILGRLRKLNGDIG